MLKLAGSGARARASCCTRCRARRTLVGGMARDATLTTMSPLTSSNPQPGSDLVVPAGPGLRQAMIIPAGELAERFSRASGPGGQGVNTTDSRVELVFRPATGSFATSPTGSSETSSCSSPRSTAPSARTGWPRGSASSGSSGMPSLHPHPRAGPPSRPGDHRVADSRPSTNAPRPRRPAAACHPTTERSTSVGTTNSQPGFHANGASTRSPIDAP